MQSSVKVEKSHTGRNGTPKHRPKMAMHRAGLAKIFSEEVMLCRVLCKAKEYIVASVKGLVTHKNR